MTKRKEMTIEQFHAALKAQVSATCREDYCLVCPMCGTIQDANDLIKAGAGKTFEEVEKYLGFSCVGRFTHQKPPPKEKGTQEGCNWSLGGLFQFHNLVIITPDGKKHPSFEPASAEQFQEHLAKRTSK